MWMDEELAKAIVGKTILSVWMDGNDELLFETDAGVVAYMLDGDCCSVSYFADLCGVAALIGGKVAKLEPMEVTSPYLERTLADTRDESVQPYGYKITTDKGQCDVIFRNASNGYYGGSMENSARTDLLGATKIEADWMA